MATSGWLAVAAAWKPAAFPVPATPEKFAPSHALGGALIAVTRQGKQWATPEVVAVRIVARAMAVVRRGRTWPTTPVITHTDALQNGRRGSALRGEAPANAEHRQSHDPAIARTCPGWHGRGEDRDLSRQLGAPICGQSQGRPDTPCFLRRAMG